MWADTPIAIVSPMPRRYPMRIGPPEIIPKKNSFPRHPTGFFETMDCLPVSRLPEGTEWTYEIKLDGYRLEAGRSAGRTTLYSRRKNILNHQSGRLDLRSQLLQIPNIRVQLACYRAV